jgi:hypothetical protein
LGDTLLLYIRSMNEASLKKIHINDLYNLLMKSTTELIALTHTESTEEYEAKKNEVELIQRVLIARRAEVRPGTPL